MRKTLLRTLFMVLIIAIACSFAVACDFSDSGDQSQSTHEHVASGEWQSDASQHWKVCAEDNEKVDVADHTFGEWVIDEVETCTEKGKKHKECSVCKYKVEEDIPAKNHDYVYTDNGDGTHNGVCKNDATHVIENQAHTLGEYAGHDADKHWKVCEDCEARVESEHKFVLKGDSYACECGESIEIVAKDLYKVNSETEAERKTFEIDLKVKETNVLIENQEIGAENFTVNLGEAYNGKLLSAKFGRFEVEGVTLADGVLTLPKDTFTTEDVGEQTILCVVECNDGVYKLTLHVTVATRVISSIDEWNTVLRDPVSMNTKENSGIYGYFTLAGDLDFNHEALRDPYIESDDGSYSLAIRSNYIDGKLGFAGVFDGRGYTLKNFNTANPFGLFPIASDENTIKTTIKNLVVDDVWHDNGVVRANIFGHSLAHVTFDNITINVSKTSLTGSLVDPGNGTLEGRGFICGAYANKNVYKNFTVNASGSTISALFGWWIKRSGAADDNGAIITCENFVVNAKEITYWGRLDGEGDPAMAPTDYPIDNLTYNKDVVNEIEITDNGNCFVVDLKVADTTKTLAEQVIGATDNIEIDLGKNYGTLENVKFNGEKVNGATVVDNKLILPVSLFSAGAIGEREVEVTMLNDNAVNVLSVKMLVVTKAISSAAEFKENITDKTATYGYFVLVNDIDFNNTALELPSWYDTASSAGYNDGTIYSGSNVFFAGVFDGRGYKIRNYNTGSDVDGGRYGLFGKINNATIKNVIIEDVVYTGKEYVGIFAFMSESSKFENITINVKSSALPENDITGGQYGFIIGRKFVKTSIKDMTVNAAGQEIYSFFGYWIMRENKTNEKDGNYVLCENVVINAKKVHYWGRIDSEKLGDADNEAPMDVENYPVNGVKVNVVEAA